MATIKKVTKRKPIKAVRKSKPTKHKVFTEPQPPALADMACNQKRAPEFIKQIDEYVKMREDEPLSAAIKKMYDSYPDINSLKKKALHIIVQKAIQEIERIASDKAYIETLKKFRDPVDTLSNVNFEKIAEPISNNRKKERAILSELRKDARMDEDNANDTVYQAIHYIMSNIEREVCDSLDIKIPKNEFCIEGEVVDAHQYIDEHLIDFQKLMSMIDYKPVKKKRTTKKTTARKTSPKRKLKS